MKNKFLLTGLIFLFSLSLSAETYNGTCGAQGNNLTWTLDTETGVLTISGTGAMADYSGISTPWFEYRYYSIASVVISNGVTSIGNSAFSYCYSLTSVTIPNSVTSIGSSAFSYCYSLTSVIIPNSVTSIRDGAFHYVPNIVYNGTATGSPWGAKSINGYVDGYLVYSDATKTTLNACSAAAEEELVIPNSVTSIRNRAFYFCWKLTSVTIPNSVTSIGWYTFSYCYRLTSVTIPNSVTSIGESAFYGCSGLTSVTIPNSVTSIGESAFYGCSGLTSLIIPNTVTNIANNAFGAYINLTNLEAPAPFFDIPEAQWPSYTKSLSHVTVNGGELTENALLFINRSYKTLQTLDVSGVTNTEFADEAFKGFYNLKELVLPALLQKVSYMMVAGCKNLQSVVIPASVEEIEQSAFEDCRSLQSITFGDQQNDAPGRFNVPASTTIQLKHIGNWAFYNAHELKSIEIPEGVEEIGEGAFYGCTYLEDLVLPTSVRYVGDNTFALCAKLKKITVNSVTPPSIQAKTFFDVKRQIPVYVPDGSENDYKAADGWKEFFNIQPASAMPTAIDEMQASEELTGTPCKVLVNGQLFILLPNGTRYNLQGMEIK